MHRFIRLSSSFTFCLLAFLATGPASAASLEGQWQGQGKVEAQQGEPEIIKCRAQFNKRSEQSYASTFTCVSRTEGKVTKSVSLKGSGDGSFTGAYYDDQRKLNVSIDIRLSGNRQTVMLRSSKGRATIHLTKAI